MSGAASAVEVTVLKCSGSKTITVDAQRYRYIISQAKPNAGDHVPLVITAQHELENGRHLRITGLSTRRVPLMRSKLYVGRTVERPIQPHHIERLIRLANSRGWRSTASGPTVELKMENDDIFKPEEPEKNARHTTE